MRASRRLALSLCVIGFSSVSLAAALEPVTISSEDALPSPRWIYGVGNPPKVSSDAASQLAQVKVHQIARHFELCVNQSRQLRAKAKSLQAWLAVSEVECATSLEPSLEHSNILSRAILDAEKNANWMLTGPQAPRLRSTVARGLQALLEQDIKSNRVRAWADIDQLQALGTFLDDGAKAKMWRSAGDLAFVQQKPEAARDFLKRSIALVDADETRVRLGVVESALAKGATKGAKVTASAKEVRVLQNDSSREELDLVDRITVSLKSGDFVPAMDDVMKLIRDFPGSTRAKWASDRALEALQTLSDKNDSKYDVVREQVLSRLERADGDRLSEWARVLFNRGQYAEALRFARKSLESMDGVRRTKALALEVDAAVATESWDVALAATKELIEKSSGQPQAREALLRQGLVQYRLRQYLEAAGSFEKLLAEPQLDNFELSATYWLWRALQKAQPERAGVPADHLLKKYPFSYYGLRARAELGEKVLNWTPEKSKLEVKLWFTTSERLAWEKIQLLLKAGWIEEAQVELRELSAPQRADEKALRALVWAAAGGYSNAAKLANEAWDEKSEIRRPPFTDAAFPRVFNDAISEQAKARGLDTDLVRGLIKQESAFNVRAVSTSNAMGLMQMIPPTAKEIAGQLKIQNLEIPEGVFEPQRNIQMGTFYLSQMLLKYQGHVPLALASYNAGPGRLDRWLRVRPSLANLAETRTSAPENEIWIEEIPYSETSNYVKAILRNQLLYKLLDQGRVELGDPVWAF